MTTTTHNEAAERLAEALLDYRIQRLRRGAHLCDEGSRHRAPRHGGADQETPSANVVG